MEKGLVEKKDVNVELVNNLFAFCALKFSDLYDLFSKADVKSQVLVTEKLKDLNKIINDLENLK